MKTIISYTILFLTSLCICLSSCEHIDINDLSDDKVDIVSPKDGITTNVNPITFWWEPVEEAEQYHMQISRFDFDNVGYIVLDTLTPGLFHTTSLAKGTYTWRVQAQNFGSVSPYTTHSLEIETNSNLGEQIVVLGMPMDQTITNQKEITFNWNNIETALNYNFQLAGSFSNASSVLVNENLEETNYTYTFTEEGNYEWQVKAENESSSTPFLTRSLTIDCTPPFAPDQVLPEYGEMLLSPVVLSWDSDPSSIGDTLYIYTDSLQNEQLLKIYTEQLNYTFVSEPGKYFWKLNSTDEASNVSEDSSLYQFTIL